MISFTKDGNVIIDGFKIQTPQVDHTDRNVDIMPMATIWTSVKSLTPFGNLKASDYNKFLTSKKQNVALGKALDALTVTALTAVIGSLHTYAGIVGFS